MIIDKGIDGGKAFDWGKTSSDYAKYRDIYPQEFYRRILDEGLCRDGQKVLDIGTGTGVLPRCLYSYGAEFTGTDTSLSREEVEAFNIEHRQMLEAEAPEHFNVLHYAGMEILRNWK